MSSSPHIHDKKKNTLIIGKGPTQGLELLKQDIQDGIKLVNVNVDQMQVLVIINIIGLMINADVNVKN